MTGTVVFYLPHSAAHADRIAALLDAEKREYSRKAFQEAFQTCQKIVALMAVGIVIRALAPLIRNKWEDPAVVVISPDLRYVIPLLGGHHGANALAATLAGAGLIPVITTATEVAGKEAVEVIAEHASRDILNRDSTRAVNAAILEGDVPIYTIPGPGVVIAGPRVSLLLPRGEYVVGVGCRRGIPKEAVTAALHTAFQEAGIDSGTVLVYATTDKKKGETGLRDAIADLGGNLVFLDSQTLNAEETVSPSRARDLGLRGVAEPAALALSRHHELILPKRVYGGVTIAIAR